MGFAVTGSSGGRSLTGPAPNRTVEVEVTRNVEGAAPTRTLQSHAQRNLGPTATQENKYIWGGNPGSALNWKTWGQEDIQPLGDPTTTFDQLP